MPRTARTGPGRRGDVLRLLKELDHPASFAEVAADLGIHVNTARFHLENLVESGQVERVTAERRGPGRPPQLFAAVHRMDTSGPRHYDVLAQVLIAALAEEADPGQRAAEAGRAWGRAHGVALADEDERTSAPLSAGESVEQLVGMLDQLGFAPELDHADDSSDLPGIALHRCPFLELASDRSDVVCPVHLGLMRGALESWHSPVDVDRLEPFTEADRCMTHLVPTPAR